MKALVAHRGDALAGRVLCHDVGRAFRKGHLIRDEEVPALEALPWDSLHVLALQDDIGQREAGRRLADALCCDGLLAMPAGHRHVLRALHDGLVKIDVAKLQRMNSVPGIAVYTVRNDSVAMKDKVVADVQITGLAIERALMESVDGRGVISLLPFAAREAVIWMRDDRRLAALEEKLHAFGCTIRDVLPLPREAAEIRSSMEARSEQLFLVSGSNALDPLDPVFAALGEMSASLQRVGLPVHPGTLLWLASWQGRDIIGLPTCGLGTQQTAFDLILPKLLAEGRIQDEELAALGHGGIL